MCPWKFGAAKETENVRGCDGDDSGVAMGREREKQGAREEEGGWRERGERARETENEKEETPR